MVVEKRVNQIISKGDADFIRTILLPWAKVRAVYIKFLPSSKKWPDIWVEKGKISVITVTREWQSHGKHLRRSQLVHEFLHLRGMEHDEKIGYSTHPELDSYSKMIYRRLI